jgi:hypothetical protein
MIKMPSDIAAWFQDNLYLLTLSGYSADLFICSKPDEIGGDEKFRWQFAVDMIYRGVKCGLMDVWDGQNKSRGTITYSFNHIKNLAQFDPNSNLFSDPNPASTCWVGEEIEASELCHALVKEYDIKNIPRGEVCLPFMAEIELLFEQHGVAWSLQPLIPVKV